MAKLLRLTKFIRIARLPALLKSLDTMVSTQVSSLMSFIVTACLYCHVMACLFHFVGHWGEKSGSTSWIQLAELEGANLSTRYIFSMYWALSTVSTVG